MPVAQIFTSSQLSPVPQYWLGNEGAGTRAREYKGGGEWKIPKATHAKGGGGLWQWVRSADGGTLVEEE